MKPLCIGLAVAGCAALIACGSAPDSSSFDNPVGSTDSGVGTGDTSHGGSDTGSHDDSSSTIDGHNTDTTPPPVDTSPPPPPPPTTLDNVCEKLAAVVCSSKTSACCAAHSVPYDDGGCHSGIAADCNAEVDAVKAGTVTFDASSFDACAAAWSELEGKCSVPILEYIKTYPPCMQLFNGMSAPGSSCTSFADCHADPGGFVECKSSAGNVCVQYFIVGKDATCNYDGDVIHFCDAGLYCSSSSNTCRPAKGTGAGCGGTWDPSCGFGNTCDYTNHCAPGAPMGTSCTSGLECASWSCASYPTYACTDPNVEVATKATCTGTP